MNLGAARADLQARGYSRFSTARLNTFADVRGIIRGTNCPGVAGTTRGAATNVGGSMQVNPTCGCGCGEALKIARYPSQQANYVAGHHRRKTPHEYEVRDCGHTSLCWVWTRALTPKGYSSLGPRGSAHTAYYERLVGPVPSGLELDHLCSNPPCVNPSHLEPVTHTENVRRGANTKLDWDAVHYIRSSSASLVDLGRRFGVTPTCVLNVRKGRTWREAT